MGTNYHAYINICPTCGHPGQIVHIGKSSMGWQFGFHAHEPSPWEPEDLVSVLSSKKDWKEFTAKDNVKIYDEYGEEVDEDNFWNMVESDQDNEAMLNHYRIVTSKPENEKEFEYLENIKGRRWFYDQDDAKDMWLDDEGYSFDAGYFR